MAKKKKVIENRQFIACPFYKGYLDEMPQEAKDKMKEERPDLYERIFGDE